MGKVNYKSELFDILKDLTSINNSVVFEKEEDRIIVRRSDTESTIVYQLSAPKEYFDFDGNEIAFYSYNDFYQYFKAFDEPDLYIENVKVKIKKNNAKTEYNISNPESIPAGPKSINFKDPDIRFEFSSEDHDEFIKMINLIKPKKAQITTKGNKATIKIFNNLHDNTFEKTFKVDNITDKEIDFVIFSDTFDQFPMKRNYVFEIKENGFVKISLVDENMSLDVYTARIKS